MKTQKSVIKTQKSVDKNVNMRYNTINTKKAHRDGAKPRRTEKKTMKTIAEWIEFEKQYKAAFKRCNISGAKIYELQELEAAGQLLITVTRERFTRTAPAKRWNRTPISSERETVTAEYYANYISGLDFFGGRVALNYTSRGYIAVDFSCTGPDGCTKSEAHFSFEEVRV